MPRRTPSAIFCLLLVRLASAELEVARKKSAIFLEGTPSLRTFPTEASVLNEPAEGHSRRLQQSSPNDVQISCEGVSCDVITVEEISDTATRVYRRNYENAERASLTVLGPVIVSFDKIFEVEESGPGACGYDYLEIHLQSNETSIKYCGDVSPPDWEVVAGDTLFVEWYSDGGTTDFGWSFDASVLYPSPPPLPPSPPVPPPFPMAPPLTINGSTALIHDERYAESQLRMAILDQEVATVYLQANVTLTQALPNVSRTLSIVGTCDSRCALDGAKEFQVLQVTDEGNLLLESLTLRNGRGAAGGAVGISPNSSLDLHDCSLTHNEAAHGGALYISGGCTCSAFHQFFAATAMLCCTAFVALSVVQCVQAAFRWQAVLAVLWLTLEEGFQTGRQGGGRQVSRLVRSCLVAEQSVTSGAFMSGD